MGGRGEIYLVDADSAFFFADNFVENCLRRREKRTGSSLKSNKHEGAHFMKDLSKEDVFRRRRLRGRSIGNRKEVSRFFAFYDSTR